MTDQIPAPHVESPNTARFAPSTLVWLVPIAALIVAGLVTYRTITERGPLITISFAEAPGVIAGETAVRYRDVEVGVVEKVGFTDDLGQVVLTVRIDKEVSPYVDSDAQFWIVRPEVTTRGITGLNTVLSGVYIEGNWNGTGDGVHTAFTGLDRAPLSLRSRDGLTFTLRSRREGGLTPNTPILYKGIEVGRVGQPRITDDGSGVEADAFIEAPHDGLITTTTRFWDISGVRFSLGPTGAAIDFESIATLVAGGISFQTIVSGGEVPEDGAVFEVYPDESAARNSVFEQDSQQVVTFSVIFSQNVSGLEAGAAVELSGIRVGQVTNLTGLVDEERFGDTRVRLVAVVDINIGRLGLPEGSTPADALIFLQEKVADDGLRARLTNASLLTGGLKVELVRIADAAPATIQQTEPYPLFPTAEAAVADVTASAEDVLRRVEKLPVEELLNSAIDFLHASTALVRNEDLNGAPAAIRSILSNVDAVTGSEAVQALPADVQALLTALQGTTTEAQSAIEDLRGVVADFEATGVLQRTADVLDATGAMAGDISTAARDVPELLAEFQALAQAAQAIPFAELSARLDAALASAEAVLTDETLAALPAEAAAMLAESQDLAAELRGLLTSESTQALPAQASALMADLQTAVADLRATLASTGTAATDVSTALAEVPALVAEFQGLAADARTIPFAELSARLDTLLAAADGLLSDQALAALPADVAATLADARTLAGDLRGLVGAEATQALPAQASALMTDLQTAVADLRATLASTGTAATDVSTALAEVPALVAEFQGLAADARTIPFAELSARLDTLLAAADGLLSDQALAALPADVAATLADARDLAGDLRGLVGAEATQALPAQASALMTDLQTAVADLRATLASTGTAATDVSTALAEVPALVAEFQGLAADARTIPFAELSARLDTLLAAADGLLSDQALAALPADVAATLADARTLAGDLRGLVGAEATQALPAQASALMADLQTAVADLRATLASTGTAATDVSTALAEVPALVAEFQGLAADARTIPFAELSARLDTLLAAADGLLSDQALAALPADVAATLADARTLAGDLRGLVGAEATQALPAQASALMTDMQGAVDDLRATLAEFSDRGAVDRLITAVDATTEAATGMTDAVAGLPDLIADLQAVAGQAGELPLADLTAQLTATLDAAQALLASADTQALPGSLNTALAELAALLDDLRNGGAIDNASKAFAAAEGAATSIEAATVDLPSLIRNINAALAQANATLAAFDGSSELGREARRALRDVARAASDVSSLARSIERRPNSILLGR